MPTKSAAKPQRKAPAHAEPTTSDRLKDAVEDLDKARDQAGQQAKESIDSAIARIREAASELGDKARDQTAEWQTAPESAGDDVLREARPSRRARPALARRAQGPVGRDPPSQGGARRLRGPAAGVSVPSAHRLPRSAPHEPSRLRSGLVPAERCSAAMAGTRCGAGLATARIAPVFAERARTARWASRGPRSTSPRGPPTTSRAWRSCGDCSTQAGPGGDVVGVARTARHAARRIAAAAAETVLTGAGRPRWWRRRRRPPARPSRPGRSARSGRCSGRRCAAGRST